jgi:hypothetical protein
MSELTGLPAVLLRQILGSRMPRIPHGSRGERRPAQGPVGRDIRWDGPRATPDQQHFLEQPPSSDTVLPEPESPVEAIFSNPLDGYTSAQYHISLSMVHSRVFEGRGDPRDEDRVYFASTGDTLQGGIKSEGDLGPMEVDSSDFSSPLTEKVFDGMEVTDRVVGRVASTSTEPLLVIKGLTMKSVLDVTPSNPELARIIEMGMVLHEPAGFSLDENIRSVAPGLGYRGSPARIVWRLDVWFSGYRADTGQWELIAIQDPLDPQRQHVRATYFVHIITMDSDVTHTGTQYTLSMVPIELIALRPEQIKVEGLAIEADTTFGDFLQQLGSALTKACADKSRNRIQKIFDIRLAEGTEAEKLANEPIIATTGFQSETQNLDDDRSGKVKISIARDMTVLDIIRAALNGLRKVQDDFNRPDDPDKKQPRIIYAIRPDVRMDGAIPSPDNNDYNGIRYSYIIEPHYDFRISPDRSEQASQSVREARLRNLVANGALRRVYNYTFTGENTEIINLSAKLKFYYYDDLVIPYDSASLNLIGSRESQNRGEEARKDIKTQGETEASMARRLSEEQTDEVLGRMGRPGIPHSANEPGTALRHGRTDMPPTVPHVTGSRSAEATRERARYLQDLNKRIHADLVKIEDMEVRGDPGWLFSTLVYVPEIRQAPSVACVFRLNVIAPDQSAYMDPQAQVDRRATGAEANLGGFYQVVTIEHRMEDGMYTQKITGVRLDHL